MALWSRAARDFMANNGSLAQCMEGGVFVLYQGTMPTDPDAAIVGTKLVECTTSSGTYTSFVAPRWGLNCTGDGTFRPTINSALIVPDADIAATGTIATTLANVVAAINAYKGWGNFKAWMNGSDGIIIEGSPRCGVVANAWVLADGGTATTTVSTPTGGTLGARAGVAHVNGCCIDDSADGSISTTGIWSGVIAASGTANFAVWYGNPYDDNRATTIGVSADASPWNMRRVIFSIATAGADYNFTPTALVAGRTHTVDTSTLSLAESV